jgi:hypothetical protein
VPLDSEAKNAYTVDGTDTPAFGECSEDRQGGDTMIVFLSLPDWTERYRKVVAKLQRRGLIVLTNFDRANIGSKETRTDLRLERIRRSDVYVHIDEHGHWSSVREAEFGYALGFGLQIAFVGKPLNSLHEWGDVFDDVDDFVSWWYSREYLDNISKWLPNRTGAQAVA